MKTARIGLSAIDVCRPLPFINGHPPRIGEQSVELLREAGYGDEAIERMLERGVTLQPEPTKDSEE